MFQNRPHRPAGDVIVLELEYKGINVPFKAEQT